MNEYYDRLERLRDMLAPAGAPALARDLLDAERSASTSGEALSVTGAVLQRALETIDVTDPDLRTELIDVLALGRSLWDGANGG